jgi:twitching motility two-component system response regulator PilG
MAFGLTVNEVSVLKSVCLLSSHSGRAIRHRVIGAQESPDVFLVDAADPAALDQWHRLDPQQKCPIVLIGEETQAAGRVGLRRPLLASRLLAALDKVAQRLGASGPIPVRPDAGGALPRIELKPAVRAAGPAPTPARIGGPATRMRRSAENPRTVSGGPATRMRRLGVPAKQFHVLVVDDSTTVRKQLELALRSMDHAATCVDSGEAALDLLQRNSFDLVLLDVVLPGADGYEVCKRIRRAGRNKNLPVVMLTSKSSPFDKIRGTLAGCSSYLVKPVDLKAFKATVGKYLVAGTESAFGGSEFSVR